MGSMIAISRELFLFSVCNYYVSNVLTIKLSKYLQTGIIGLIANLGLPVPVPT